MARPLVYEPKGRAREYAPLALNIYTGCPHACQYCYVRRRFGQVNTVPKQRVLLTRLEAEAKAMAGDPRPIMLSFMSDPYPRGVNPDHTLDVLRVLLGHGMSVRILSKGGLASLAHLDLLSEHRDQVEFGQTITCVDEPMRRVVEPGAAPAGERVAALQEAHLAGLRTFVSLEPLIDCQRVLDVVDQQADYVDRWNIGGPVNYWSLAARPAVDGVDWAELDRQARLPWNYVALAKSMAERGCTVGLKRDAWAIVEKGGAKAMEALSWCVKLWEV